MISKIWKLVLIWISVLCLSSIIIIMTALSEGGSYDKYFVSGYTVAALICITMFCTVLSVILKEFTERYQRRHQHGKDISDVTKYDFRRHLREEQSKLNTPMDAEFKPVGEVKEEVKEESEKEVVAEEKQPSYDDSDPTPEEMKQFEERSRENGL